MDRRRFLVVSSQAGMVASFSQLFSLPVWAQPSPDAKFQNLITIHFDGGWDVLLGLDPKIKNLPVSDTAFFTGYREDEIIRAANLRFGPSAQPIANLADRCVVINGASMLGNISHFDCKRMSQTGIIDRRTAQIVSLKASSEAAEYGGTAAVMNINAPQIESGQLDVDIKSYYEIQSFAQASPQEAVFIDTDSFLARNQAESLRYGKLIRDLIEKTPELGKKLQDGSNDSHSSSLISLAIALRTGYVNGAHIEIRPRGQRPSLDTHSNHQRDHKPSQADCWQQVADLVAALESVPLANESGSVFDQTLIMVTSEFSRESSLNGNSIETSGKEHNGYTNSYLLIGGRLPGGYSIGESVVQQNMLGKPTLHTARNFDFRTGKVIHALKDAPEYMADKAIKKQIQPGHIVRTLADVFGYGDLLDPTLKKLSALPLKI